MKNGFLYYIVIRHPDRKQTVTVACNGYTITYGITVNENQDLPKTDQTGNLVTIPSGVYMVPKKLLKTYKKC